MTSMTPKERVLTAFAHQEPDRVPINYLSNPGIDRRLKAYFGLAADDTDGLLCALGVDFRSVNVPYVGPRLHAEVPDRLVDPCWGVHTRWVEHESGGYWDFCDFPLQDASRAEVEAWPMPSPDDFDYSMIPALCQRYTNYCLVLGHAGVADIINATGRVRTMEQVLVDLILDEEACLSYIDRRLQVELAVLSRTLEAAAGCIDLLWMGEDLGTQHSPLISLELYRKHLRPRHQQIIDLARHWNIPVMVHTCGSSSWAYDDFIEMGVAVVDTLQPEAANMAPAYLKERFGQHLAFHGCISTAGAVAYGTVNDVETDVRQTLEIMMPGGGYALAPTHCLQDNTPTENAVAMYEAAKRYGVYRHHV
ncbi:MAG TPA: uroporphyrinogen decarboxylase family protein [Armatimonadota bacterium]|nr:uroporphyrinogen decarboxylase family protein [Armatimonadota bacterium]